MSQLIFVVDDQCFTIDNREEISEQLANKGHFYEIASLPEGEGILRRAEDGTFYYEPFPELTPIEPVNPIEPEQPQPTETTEEKLERVLKQLDVQQKQNLILLDVNMTIYEELLLMQKGLSNA